MSTYEEFMIILTTVLVIIELLNREKSISIVNITL